jgi:hypothetical protein
MLSAGASSPADQIAVFTAGAAIDLANRP